MIGFTVSGQLRPIKVQRNSPGRTPVQFDCAVPRKPSKRYFPQRKPTWQPMSMTDHRQEWPEQHWEQEKRGHLRDLGSNPSLASGKICGPKQFMSPPWASISSSINGDGEVTIFFQSSLWEWAIKCLEHSIHSIHDSCYCYYHDGTASDLNFRDAEVKIHTDLFSRNIDDKTHNDERFRKLMLQ